MAKNGWNWKNKDGSTPGLLYESGNWGDLLKMLWLATILDWKRQHHAKVNYFDPFAGDIHYPVSRKTRHRLHSSRLARLDFLNARYLDHDRWPSAASGARLLVNGTVEVWDADPGRRGAWENEPGVTVPHAECGWALLRDHAPDPDAVWLVDPYDFLAEWREWFPEVVRQSRSTTVLLYLYNRSARSDTAFTNYRDWKNALEDAAGTRPKRLGRIPADTFLPRAHHEMLFLPSQRDEALPGFANLLHELDRQAECLAAGHNRVSHSEA